MRGVEEDRPDETPKLRRFSRLEFHPTHLQTSDGGEPLLGCPRATAWLVVDDDTLRIFEALWRKASIERAEAWLAERTGEAWDAEDLARLLVARGFVRAIDGIALDARDRPGRQHRIVFRAPSEAVRGLHHPFVLGFVGALAACWFLLLALWPALLPRPSHLLLTGHPALNIVAAFGAGVGFIAAHEAAHYLLARSYGIDARIRIAHRLYILVVETDCTNAWLLKPHQRIQVFLAGMCTDLALGTLLAMGIMLAQSGAWNAPWLVAPLLFLQFLAIVPVAYQLLFFARTDLYYVLLAWSGERRLVDDAKTWGRLFLHRLTGTPRSPCAICRKPLAPAEPYCPRCRTRRDVEDPSRFPIEPRQERRLALFSAVLFPAGLLVASYAIVSSALVGYLQGALAYRVLTEGLARGDALLAAEGVLALAVTLVSLGLVALFLIQDAWRVLRRLRRPAPA